MQKRNIVGVLVSLSLLSGGCVRDRIRPVTHPEPNVAGDHAEPAAGTEPFAAEGGPAPGTATHPAPESAPNAASSSETKPATRALTARYPELTGPPLPELSVKSFGLHLSSGAKDEETRAAFLRQLEHGFPDYLECYRELETPGKEGTFGADLRIEAQGGRARVEQTRTKLSGDEFKQCMVRSIEALRFKAPPSGRAMMVSYSVKFSWR